MRIKLFATIIFSAVICPVGVTVAQDAPVNGIQRFTWRQDPVAASAAPATLLRASTGTGISKAVIDRQDGLAAEAKIVVPEAKIDVPKVAPAIEGERVAALPQSFRSRAKVAPPEMKRKPFLVGFRKPAQTPTPDAAVAGEVKANAPTSVVEATPQTEVPEIPAAEDYGFTVEPAPETDAADAQASNTPPEPELTEPSNATKDEVDYCCRDCRPRPVCNLGCEKKLFPKNCNGFEMGGWLSQGYHNREDILTNNRQREWNLHQAWLYAGKEATGDSCDWDFGYRADLLYGIDAQDLQAFGNAPSGAPAGWDNGWDNGAFGWALPQLYVEFANLDWNVKLGKFFSPFGYEVIAAPDNFFYSHSFTMYNSEPFTMSGVLAERKVSDTKSYVMGLTAGWDTGFESNGGGATVILGSREQITDDINFAITSSWGDAGLRGSGGLTSAVAQVSLTDSVDYVLQADFLNLDQNQEFGIVQYLFKEFTSCFSIGARLEWWKSDQFFTTTSSTYNWTVGANYRRNANVTIRPEIRTDWGAAAVSPGQPILGIDVIRTF